MNWLSRSTVFAAFFTVTSFILALKGLLTGQYVAMATALQGWVVARAVAQDYHDRNTKDKQ
jgi:heme O synthase-like polyprenyltransferase